ncbi:hypothetical protein Pint_05101 [Pistacia integerrima]|uniref:Uncharacterized protein n=1 Tax=Pistacia integerrima TaxID=434235 RepID=A0ACC0Z2Q3_9ROSI|nr:hypothetical protein Pint_05101 [Pistacia integerrima]
MAKLSSTFLSSLPITIWLLLLAFILIQGVEGSIGVNYGTVADNLPPPSKVAHFLLESTVINRVRLFDANPEILKAFARTGIEVTVTVPNDQISHLAKLTSAQQWLKTYIQPHTPATNIVRNFSRQRSPFIRKQIANREPSSRHANPPHRPRRGVSQPSNPSFDASFFRHSLIFEPSLLRQPKPGGLREEILHKLVLMQGVPAEYNRNLMRHVTSGVGTPLMPNRTFETYIFALFNEDLKQGPTSERNFGLFEPDLTPAYDIGILRSTVAAAADNHHVAYCLLVITIGLLARSSIPTNPKPGPIVAPVTPVPAGPMVKGKKWCLPKRGAEIEALQSNIDYVCGLGLDCGAIQVGGSCFLPNTVRAHAAYAMNVYYQAMGRNDYDCDFKQTGAISDVDPSMLRKMQILILMSANLQ